MGHRKYDISALASVKAQGKTSAQVSEMGYAEIAALCKVTLGANGESPPDFFYRLIRNRITHQLAQEELEATVGSRTPR